MTVDCTIEFIPRGAMTAPPPRAAAREMPEWLKHMPGEVEVPRGEPGTTIKRCPPFVEAVGFGYLLPAPADMLFTADAQGTLSVQSTGEAPMLMPPEDYAGASFAGHYVVKFPNPWIIRTPPGYSTLLLPPLNRSDFPFRILSQLIETDAGRTVDAFPAISLVRPGQTFQLIAGAPLIQAVPIRREQWDLSVKGLDAPRFAEQHAGLARDPHYYKADHWQKKGYT